MLFEQNFAAWGITRRCSEVSAALCATAAVIGGFGSGVNRRNTEADRAMIYVAKAIKRLPRITRILPTAFSIAFQGNFMSWGSFPCGPLSADSSPATAAL
jgi:hypothetical protein